MKHRHLFLSLILTISATTFAQEKTTYPLSEWDCAKCILMHTPGEELFDGVIHPYAGLFEYYFDVDKAAEEHKGYIDALKRNGIEVYTVRELLNQTDIEKLRAHAMNTLTYDTSEIPEATGPDSEEYRKSVINQMSRTDLIRCILLRPTVKLYDTDNNTGVEAVYTHSPLMNLYFTRDQSITTPRGHIISKMNSTQRADETSIIALCYEQLGATPILSITGDSRLEGGDYLRGSTISYIGCGMRTNLEAIKQRGFTIIPIKLEDELHYANNFLTIAPRHIMAVGNQSAELQKAFTEHNVKVEWIPLETLIKGYGAAHCMTQVIKANTVKKY